MKAIEEAQDTTNLKVSKFQGCELKVEGLGILPLDKFWRTCRQHSLENRQRSLEKSFTDLEAGFNKANTPEKLQSWHSKAKEFESSLKGFGELIAKLNPKAKEFEWLLKSFDELIAKLKEKLKASSKKADSYLEEAFQKSAKAYGDTVQQLSKSFKEQIRSQQSRNLFVALELEANGQNTNPLDAFCDKEKLESWQSAKQTGITAEKVNRLSKLSKTCNLPKEKRIEKIVKPWIDKSLEIFKNTDEVWNQAAVINALVDIGLDSCAYKMAEPLSKLRFKKVFAAFSGPKEKLYQTLYKHARGRLQSLGLPIDALKVDKPKHLLELKLDLIKVWDLSSSDRLVKLWRTELALALLFFAEEELYRNWDFKRAKQHLELAKKLVASEDQDSANLSSSLGYLARVLRPKFFQKKENKFKFWFGKGPVALAKSHGYEVSTSPHKDLEKICKAFEKQWEYEKQKQIKQKKTVHDEFYNLAKATKEPSLWFMVARLRRTLINDKIPSNDVSDFKGFSPADKDKHQIKDRIKQLVINAICQINDYSPGVHIFLHEDFLGANGEKLVNRLPNTVSWRELVKESSKPSTNSLNNRQPLQFRP